MTARELIARLYQLPQDARVVIPGYEGGFDDVELIRQILVFKTSEESGIFGRYCHEDDYWLYASGKGTRLEEAITLSDRYGGR